MAIINQLRGNVIKLIFASAFLLLIIRLVQFQIINTTYSKIADNNAYFKKVVWPSRGNILDRKGIEMVKNIPIYDLQVTPNAIKGMDTSSLCRILNIDTAFFNKKMDSLYKRNRSNPALFSALLPYDVQVKLEEKMYSFPGFDIVQRNERSYPLSIGANVFGYLTEVDSNAIKRSNGKLRMGDYSGRIGLERNYDNVLRGERGVEIFIRDSKQRIIEKYEDGKFDTLPIAGRNIKTFLDVKLQKLAEKLMKNKLGAAIAIDPKTGGILAMASGPGYDPNLLSGADKMRNLNILNNDPTMPTFNFAINGQYPPGSTFKPLGALIALDEGVMQPSNTVGCSGRYRACGGKGVGCHGGHTVNLRNALAVSCNSYFSTVFRKALDNPQYANVITGYLKWKEYLYNIGLGHRLGIDIPFESKGSLPDTNKIRKERGNAWTSCSVLTLGIGQDQMLATPLQMANAVCFIANKGYYYTPHFVDSIVGETKEDTILNKYRIKHTPVHIPDSSFEAVHDGMQAVLEGDGTAKKSKISGITICGKTGTADNFFRGVKQKPHSWFVCFAPREDPKIAVAVLVLNAGQGAKYGAPIASLLIEQYIKDTLNAGARSRADQMSRTSVIPADAKYKKYVKDSIEAFKRFEETGDMSYIKMYLPPDPPQIYNADSLAMLEKEKSNPSKNNTPISSDNFGKKPEAVLPTKLDSIKNKKTTNK